MGVLPRSAAFAGAVLIAVFAAGCPKPPAAILPVIDSPAGVEGPRTAFNADAGHRRLLVLLSPT